MNDAQPVKLSAWPEWTKTWEKERDRVVRFDTLNETRTTGQAPLVLRLTL
ncbi:MAG: hypothetical protein ABI540_07900 [Spartobacteria bacterium]